MREIDGVSNPSIEVLRSASELFVSQSIDEMAQAVSRYSIDPESVRKAFGDFGDSKLNDAQIAERLGKIKVFDKELQNIDLSTDDGLAQATTVADGKLISTIEATTDRKKLQSSLKNFRDYILDKTGAVIVKVGGRKAAIGAMALITALTAACTPMAVGPVAIIDGETHPTTTETSPTTAPTKPETQIPTQAATQAATKTPAATIEPSPTAEPSGLMTEFKGDYMKNLPIIKEEDITSGAIALKEQELLASGVIAPFPEGTTPFTAGKNVRYIVGNDSRMLFPFNKDVRESYKTNKDLIPYKIADLAITEIDGQKMLMMGVMYKNTDETVGFIHYGFQSYDNEKNAEAISKIIAGELTIWPLSYVKGVLYWEKNYDFSLEPVMLDIYKKDEAVRDELLKQWAKLGKTPSALEKLLLMPCIWPWN